MTETPGYYRINSELDIGHLTGDLPHFIGAAIEYVYRAGRKDTLPAVDVRKVKRLLAMERERLDRRARGGMLGRDVMTALLRTEPDGIRRALYHALHGGQLDYAEGLIDAWIKELSHADSG